MKIYQILLLVLFTLHLTSCLTDTYTECYDVDYNEETGASTQECVEYEYYSETTDYEDSEYSWEEDEEESFLVDFLIWIFTDDSDNSDQVSFQNSSSNAGIVRITNHRSDVIEVIYTMTPYSGGIEQEYTTNISAGQSSTFSYSKRFSGKAKRAGFGQTWSYREFGPGEHKWNVY
jgi:hypothetical protein